MAPPISKEESGQQGGGWRKKSTRTVTVLYSYSYTQTHSSAAPLNGSDRQSDAAADDAATTTTTTTVSMREGERLVLLEKSNADWWQVRRPGDKNRPFYAPASYLHEDGSVKSSRSSKGSSASSAVSSREDLADYHHAKQQQQQQQSRSDESLLVLGAKPSFVSGGGGGGGGRWSSRVANAELRKQRSTSMDAIMFLQLLENEVKDIPTTTTPSAAATPPNVTKSSSSSSSAFVDKFKKPRISKDLWDRRRSWAVEDGQGQQQQHLQMAMASSSSYSSSNRYPALTEETFQPPPLPPRFSIQPLSRQRASTAAAAIGTTKSTTAAAAAATDKNAAVDAVIFVDKKEKGRGSAVADKAPALPPKKHSREVGPMSIASSSSPSPSPSTGRGGGGGGGENYSRVTPVQQQQQQLQDNQQRRLSESLEKLAQQITINSTPLSYPHPKAPPRRWSATASSSSSSAAATHPSTPSPSPPQLPPKISIVHAKLAAAAGDRNITPSPLKSSSSSPSSNWAAKDNYVNLLRPLTTDADGGGGGDDHLDQQEQVEEEQDQQQLQLQQCDDIQSDESGINMSFNNPLFANDKDDRDEQRKRTRGVDLESSIDEEQQQEKQQQQQRRKGSSSSRLIGGLSPHHHHLSGSEFELTAGGQSSSGEDILSSSKDSLNSIPSIQSCDSPLSSSKSPGGGSIRLPPASPSLRQRPQRQLYDGWYEYVDGLTNRPFYYNRETRAKSWKPPRRRASSPGIIAVTVTRNDSIEEEEDQEVFETDQEEEEEDTTTAAAAEEEEIEENVVSAALVVEAARNRALPPVPPGYTQTIDPETDDVFYTHPTTGARWYTSLDSQGRIYFYEEDSNESLWALPAVATTSSSSFSSSSTSSTANASSSTAFPVAENKATKSTPTISVMATTDDTVASSSSSAAKGSRGLIQQGVFYPEGSKLNPKPSPAAQPLSSSSRWVGGSGGQVRYHASPVGKLSKGERNSKSRSMVLTNFSGCVEDISGQVVSSSSTGVGGHDVAPLMPHQHHHLKAHPSINSAAAAAAAASKTASLPRQLQPPSSSSPQWPTLMQGGSIRVLQQGILQKTKLTENGKKIRKHWTSSWVVLTDLFLFLFKESAASKMASSSSSSSSSQTALSGTTNKPELCVDLNGATIEWAAVKSSRKGVFQVSTLLGVQLLLQDEDETNAVLWYNEIKRAINRLPCGGRSASSSGESLATAPQYPTPQSGRKPTPTVFLSPPSPSESGGGAAGMSSLSKQGSKKTRLGRTKSTKVNKVVPFLGSTEDLTAASPSPERQIKLRDKLRKFFVRRPTVESLVKKGIWKDEPVFGCHLAALCASDESTVPKFVQKVIQLIESKVENMKADGIYRASGNLSQIQKIRCQVDQNNWSLLETEDDVHVLTGCLKLFFRELKEPLIPCPLFERALQVASVGNSKSERVRKYKEIVDSLATENYDTLHFLFRHLLNITEYRDSNRMHISNLAIVFGPTLMWAATASNNLALDMMQQNLVVEALLNHFHSIFAADTVSGAHLPNSNSSR